MLKSVTLEHAVTLTLRAVPSAIMMIAHTRTATVSAEVTAMRVRTTSAAVTKVVKTLVQISGPNQPNSC